MSYFSILQRRLCKDNFIFINTAQLVTQSPEIIQCSLWSKFTSASQVSLKPKGLNAETLPSEKL